MGLIFSGGGPQAPDPIIQITGPFGTYQTILCLTLFYAKFLISFHQFAIIFLNPKMSFTCDGEADKCPCPNPVYNTSVFEKTLQSDFNLICDRKFLGSLQQCTFQIGVLVGSLLFGQAADKFGRKKPLLVAVVIQNVCGVAAAFVDNYWVFMILRIFVGASVGGTMVTTFVIVMEFVGPQHREVLSALYQVPFNLGHVLIPVIGYFTRNWQRFQFVISITGVLMFLYIWVPETPRYLIAYNRIDEAVAILTTAAKTNKRPTDVVKSKVMQYKASLGSSGSKGTMADLFKTPNIRKNILCMSFNWLACSYCFYGVGQYVGQLMGDPFLNVGMSALLTTIGTLLSIPIMKLIGRRSILIIFNGLAAFCLVILALIPKSLEETLAPFLATIGLASAFVVFVVVYLYTSELFPTVIRNAAMGLCSSTARVGSIMAPFVVDLKTVGEWCPPLLFAVFPFIACFLSFMVPETKGTRLLNTIEEGEAFGKKT